MTSNAAVMVKVAETKEELAAAFAVRQRVFVEEQGVPQDEEYDAYDATAVHVIGLANDAVIGTGRFYRLPSGEARLGRMAVDRAFRRLGTGGRLLGLLEEEAKRRGVDRILLHAQTYVVAFYTSHGYRAEGDTFLEAGIEHVAMHKALG